MFYLFKTIYDKFYAEMYLKYVYFFTSLFFYLYFYTCIYMLKPKLEVEDLAYVYGISHDHII